PAWKSPDKKLPPASGPESLNRYTAVSKNRRTMRIRHTLFLFAVMLPAFCPGADQPGSRESAEIRGAMEFLASDALQGRASGSHDELLAAVYLASQLRQIGIEPAGDNGGYIQDVSGEFRF